MRKINLQFIAQIIHANSDEILKENSHRDGLERDPESLKDRCRRVAGKVEAEDGRRKKMTYEYDQSQEKA